MPASPKALLRAAFICLAILVLMPVGRVGAHTGLDASDPADGTTVEGPLSVITLDFTGTPTAIDDGIAVADAAGNQYLPVAVTQDELRITATFDPPLGEGSYALSWVVRSDDTHTIDGSFSFSVTVPAATTAVPTTTASETTSAPATTVANEPGVATTEPPPSTTAVVAQPVGDADDGELAVAPVVPPVPPAVADADDGESVARIGRLVFVPAAVVLVGVLAFAAAAFAGRRDELRTLLRLVRWLGVAVAFGAFVEIAGLDEILGDDLFGSEAGRAAMARVLGGVLVVAGIATVGTDRARSLSAAVIDVDPAPPEVEVTPRWRPAGRDLVGMLGVALIVGSFAFDGHTLSEGPRALHALTSIVHVLAASAWAGGLVALGVVLWIRYRSEVPSSALAMIVPFSVVAMIALAVAGAAGVVMALFIESDPSAYVSTEWGRLMLAKLALVGIAAAIGAYNHFRLAPELDRSPEDPTVLRRTRATVTTEAALLVGAALVTAILVGASTL